MTAEMFVTVPGPVIFFIIVFITVFTTCDEKLAVFLSPIPYDWIKIFGGHVEQQVLRDKHRKPLRLTNGLTLFHLWCG